MLLDALSDLVKVNPPRADTRRGDRRSTTRGAEATEDTVEEEVLEGDENQAEAENDPQDTEFRPDAPDTDDTQPGDPENTELPLDEWEDIASELLHDLSQLEEEGRLAILYRQALQSSSYYWAPGWYGTGQEHVRHLSHCDICSY